MTPADLSRTVALAVCGAVERGELPAVPEVRVVVERSRPGGRGEYASNVALRLAKGARRAPGEVAELLRDALVAVPGIAAVEITPPGFLNFTLHPDDGLAARVREQGLRYGHGDALAGREVLCPGGDELRGRVYGEVLAGLVRAQGGTPVPGGSGPAPLRRQDGVDVERRLGAEATRWGILDTPAKETPAFTSGLLRQHEDNPLFRVRYAHSRARALLRNAADLGFGPAATAPDAQPEAPATTVPDAQPAAPATTAPDARPEAPAAGTAPADRLPAPPGPAALLRALAEYPLVLEAAAHHRAPDRLTRHLVTIADALLDVQHDVLPLGDEKPSVAHRSRLAVAEAAGTVLAGGLSLLGIDAPESL
ncbi:ArgS-related anticodon-binding protein NrtL [Streptomyces sp. NPDC089919]|uniref:ArgS-related anticodon-binding protein NrtL n=1 Tax=Streptomyces sp. NPDC089919 TaxID=3155188 RepID=UPI0034246001